MFLKSDVIIGKYFIEQNCNVFVKNFLFFRACVCVLGIGMLHNIIVNKSFVMVNYIRKKINMDIISPIIRMEFVF